MKDGKTRAFGMTGFGLIIAAPFFIFNPEYSVIDFLPDVVGYALILIAMRRMRDVNSYFERSEESFRRAFLLTAAKLGSIFFLFSGLFNESNRATTSLLLAFLFGVGEIIILWTAWKELFAGLSYLAADSESGLFGRTQAMSVFTRTFVVLKALLCFLPEVSVLSSHTYDEGHFDWSVFIWLFRVSSVMIGAVLGLVWLILITVYFSRLSRAKESFARADVLYNENLLSKPSVMTRRAIRRSSAVVCVFFLLSADFYLDSVNVIPDFLAGLCALFAFAMLGRFSKKLRSPGMILSAAYAAVSALSWALGMRFSDRWQLSDVVRRTEAHSAFLQYYPFRVAEALLAAAVSLMLLAAISRIILDHCGYIPATAGEKFVSDKLKSIRRGLFIRLNVTAVIAAAACLSSALQDYLQTLPYRPEFDVSYGDAGYMLSGVLGAWWAVTLLLTVLAAIFCFSTCAAIVNEADSRYMLD